MKTIKELRVKVTYEVGLAEVEIPDRVAALLQKSVDNLNTISMDEHGEYGPASRWLLDNIRETDCMEWFAEIENLI